MTPLFKLITGSYVNLDDVMLVRLLDGNRMTVSLRTGQDISFPVSDRAAFDAEVARINAARRIDRESDAISSMLDREGLTRGYGRAAINSVEALIGEHARLRELLKEAHECLQDYRGYIMGQTELSTSVDRLLFRIPNVLEATKPRK